MNNKVFSGLIFAFFLGAASFIAGSEWQSYKLAEVVVTSKEQIEELQEERAELLEEWRESNWRYEDRLADARHYGCAPPHGAPKALVLQRVKEMRSLADDWEWNAKQVKEGEPVNP